MKHTLTRILMLSLCAALFAGHTAALKPEMPETADEVAVSTAASLADESKYAAKPAETTENGKLVYFNNGNEADAVNTVAVAFKGLNIAQTVVAPDGYSARQLSKDGIGYGLYGVLASAPNGKSFVDADGNVLDGTLTFVMEAYTDVAENTPSWLDIWEGSAKGTWGNMNSGWKKLSMTAGEWTTLTYTHDTTAYRLGFGSYTGDGRYAANDTNVYIRSMAVYYKANAQFAPKPEVNTENGTLIYFNNGKAADTVNAELMNVIGLDSTLVEANGYSVRRLHKDGIGYGMYGVLVSASNGKSFVDADGKALEGTLTFVMDAYTEVTENTPSWLDIFASSAKGVWGNMNTGWGKFAMNPGEWTTLTYTHGTNAYRLGFGSYTGDGRYAANETNVYIRSIAVYYQPVSVNTSDKYSVRTTDPSGIRFGGFISAQTRFTADECGFIIARADQLSAANLTAADEVKISKILTEKEGGAFTAQTANEVKLVGARNYVKGGQINKLTETPDGSTPFGEFGEAGAYFTGVVINLDGKYTAADGKTYDNRYEARLVARSYVKIGSSYFYGDCAETSLYDVVWNIFENDQAEYAKNQEYYEKILEA